MRIQATRENTNQPYYLPNFSCGETAEAFSKQPMYAILEHTITASLEALCNCRKFLSSSQQKGLVPKRFMPRRVIQLTQRAEKMARPIAGLNSPISKRKSFTEPQWLLPPFDGGGQIDVSNDHIDEGSKELYYKVTIRTSDDFNAGMHEPNTGVLLAIHGEIGSFLHRISPFIGYEVDSPFIGYEAAVNDVGSDKRYYRTKNQCFQRNSNDVVIFCGPNVGTIKAVWISPEVGTWKVEEMSMMVFPQKVDMNGTYFKDDNLKAFQYRFANKGILIGGDILPAVELKAFPPSQVPYQASLLLDSQVDKEMDIFSQAKREQGMQEYLKLKVALLSYTAMLVIFGTTMAVASGSSDIATGFLVGGVSGFLYLYSLQRVVDQLPASSALQSPKATESQDKDGDDNGDGDVVLAASTRNAFNGFKAPLTKFAGITGLAALFLRFPPNLHIPSMSKETILAGAAGFFMSKIATVLASRRSF